MVPIRKLKPLRGRAGITLVEVVISAALFSMMAAGLATVDFACRKLVRAERETALASQSLDELVDRLRASNWSGLTDPDTASSVLSKFESSSLGELQNVELRVSVAPYPPVSPAPTPLVVERQSDGAVQVISKPSGNLSLRSFLAVRVDTHLEWQASDGHRTRSRELASVVSLSGNLK